MASPAEPIGPHEEETEDYGDGKARRLLPRASGAPWRAAIPVPPPRWQCLRQVPNVVSVESDGETDDEEEETEEGGDGQARRLLPCASGARWRAALPVGGACATCPPLSTRRWTRRRTTLG